MVRSVGFFRGVCLTAAFMAALLSFPEIASGKKEPMAGKARGVDVKARTVAAKIGMARGTWRVPFNALAQREQRKLDRPLRAMVRIPDNVKLGFYYAKNYGIELEGEEPIFHITVVTDGSTIEIEDLGLKLRPFVGDMFSTTATFQQILALAKLRNVVRIELCERFKPLLDESVPKTSANMAHALEYSSGTTNDGEGVIVGIVDSGIDWSHEDFIDDNTGTSRILFIWDQVDSTEYTQADINDEIDGTPVGYVAEVDEDGHGTHVAGIAAGDGSAGSYPGKYTGMAPKADLIVFKLNQWTRDEIRDGVAYIMQKADLLGRRAVINLSLGTHRGPHDGTHPLAVAIDNLINTYENPVVVSAGNEGEEGMHTRGTVNNDTVDVELNVPPYTPDPEYADVMISEIYYPNTEMSILVQTPSGTIYGPVAVGNVAYWWTNEGFIWVENDQGAIDEWNEIDVEVWEYGVTIGSDTISISQQKEPGFLTLQALTME